LTRALIDALLAATPQVPYSKTLIGDDQVKVEIAPPAGSRPPASGCSDGDADVPAAPPGKPFRRVRRRSNIDNRPRMPLPVAHRAIAET